MFTIGLITNLIICEKKYIFYVRQFKKKFRFYWLFHVFQPTVIQCFYQVSLYLKRAPDSSGRAVLRCGMSWGPSAAGGSLTSATLSLFSELQAK